MRNCMHHTKGILGAVTCSHSPPQAKLIERYKPGPIECGFTLVLVPHIDEKIHVAIWSIDVNVRDIPVPVIVQFIQCTVGLLRG